MRSALRPLNLSLSLSLLLALSLALPLLPACGGTDAGSDADVLSVDSVGEATIEEVAAELPPVEGSYPPSATLQQIAALEEVNKYRRSVGLDVVDMTESLNLASQAHAEFIVNHCQQYGETGLSPHNEDASWGDDFTGVQPWDRMEHFGHKSYGMSEVIAFVSSPVLAVQGWMNTLYHRLPLIDPTTVEVGYGQAMTGSVACKYQQYLKANVMDIGMVLNPEDVFILFPPDGATLVPRSFDGYESPQPPIPPGGYPSGYIATVQFGRKLAVKVTNHQLLENGTTPIDHVFLAAYADEALGIWQDPHADGDPTLSLYAYKPLAALTPYTVVIDMERGGAPLHLEWTFTTGNK